MVDELIVSFADPISLFRKSSLSFRVDEFVKFDEFDEKLLVHAKWLDGWKISLMPIYDSYW